MSHIGATYFENPQDNMLLYINNGLAKKKYVTPVKCQYTSASASVKVTGRPHSLHVFAESERNSEKASKN